MDKQKQNQNENQSQNHYLNVTLQNPEEEKEEIIISLSGIFKQLKRFLLIWLAIALIIGILVPVYYAVFAADQHKNLTATVSFNYSGIEKGKAPDGSDFNASASMKNPAVLEKALTAMNLDLSLLESVRQNISVEGVIPPNAQDKINMYKSIYEEGNLNAGEKMLEVDVNPTKYNLTFNYSGTGLEGKVAVELFNTILTSYSEYFFEMYGVNQALGNAISTLDYTEYDYSQAVDVFDSTLDRIETYLDNLSKTDKTRFCSTTTGHTFSDLSESVAMIRNVDLDVLTSYITVNNVTKDKVSLEAYYNYRIEELTRNKKVAEDELKTVTDSIKNYEKDTIIVYGGEGQDVSEYTQSSDAYNDLINQKIEAQKKVSNYEQQIQKAQERLTKMKSTSAASKKQVKKIEEDLASLNEKINQLMEEVNATAEEYYKTVYLANAYSILVPASSSALVTVKNIIGSSEETILILEAILFVLYFGTSFVLALIEENKNRKKAENAGNTENNNFPDESGKNSNTETFSPKTEIVTESTEFPDTGSIPSFIHEEEV